MTGWLYTTDAFWGVAWVGELHEVLTDILIALVALHILGVIFTSIRHRENFACLFLYFNWLHRFRTYLVPPPRSDNLIHRNDAGGQEWRNN